MTINARLSIIRRYRLLPYFPVLEFCERLKVAGNPSAFFLAAQGQNDGSDSFGGQPSRGEISEQTALRKRTTKTERKLSEIRVTLSRAETSPAKIPSRETRPPCNLCSLRSCAASDAFPRTRTRFREIVSVLDATSE